MFSAGLLTGLVASVAGFNSPLSVLFGSIGALCLGYVVSVFARRYSGAGAVYEYLVHGPHPGVGVFCAGLYGLGVLFLGGGGVFIANGFLADNFFSSLADRIRAAAAHADVHHGVPPLDEDLEFRSAETRAGTR